MYEEYWNSEEEEDQGKLAQLMRTDFIEDFHKASEIPEVLPEKDQEQISKGRKVKAREQKTLEQLIEEKSSEFILFKLPSSLNSIKKLSENNNKDPHLKELQDSHCLADLPRGTQVGKLQLLQSGRIVMNINEQILDVTQAIPSQCFETAVRIETLDTNEEPTTSNNNNPSTVNGLIKIEPGLAPVNSNDSSKDYEFLKNSNNELPNSKIKTKGRNTVQVLGEIPYSFVCSYDYRLRSRIPNKKS